LKGKSRQIGYKNSCAKRITERPQSTDDREPGHWEMDTVDSGIGKKGCLLVLTERNSRKEILEKLESRTQECVVMALDRLEKRCNGKFSEIFKTVTCDNGGEFLDSDSMESSCLGDGKRTFVYFAAPHSAFQRGSNEVNNKLIRIFIKKGEEIGKVPGAYIKRIEKWMNNYPRKLFHGKTSHMIFRESLEALFTKKVLCKIRI
jgi:IS30 family transposase